jgi:hypothetical protein
VVRQVGAELQLQQATVILVAPANYAFAMSPILLDYADPMSWVDDWVEWHVAREVRPELEFQQTTVILVAPGRLRVFRLSEGGRNKLVDCHQLMNRWRVKSGPNSAPTDDRNSHRNCMPRAALRGFIGCGDTNERHQPVLLSASASCPGLFPSFPLQISDPKVPPVRMRMGLGREGLADDVYMANDLVRHTDNEVRPKDLVRHTDNEVRPKDLVLHTAAVTNILETDPKVPPVRMRMGFRRFCSWLAKASSVAKAGPDTADWWSQQPGYWSCIEESSDQIMTHSVCSYLAP